MKLPSPSYKGGTSVEEAILNRRSIREYQDDMLHQSELSQLLWSALGITKQPDRRTAPSAGALNPLEVCVAIGNVESIQTGVYRFNPHDNTLKEILFGDQRLSLHGAAFDQDMILQDVNDPFL